MDDRKLTVRIVSADFDNFRRHWRIGQEVDDGSGAVTRHLHVIPERAVVEHAVEYGLDPGDSRTILDWLLHERFVVHQDPRETRAFCPYRNPPQVAWGTHQQAIAQVKAAVTLTDPDGHLEKIHRSHDPHPIRIWEAQDRVARDRAHVQHFERRRRSNG